MKTLLSVALTVCAMLGLSRPAAGDMINEIMIDNFSETSQSVQDISADGTAVTSKSAASEAIGGFRYLSANMVTDAAPGLDLNQEVKIEVNPGNGDSAYSAFVAKGEFSFGYDGNDGSLFDPSANPGFFDLSEMHMLGITAATEYLAGGPPIPEFGLFATLYNGAASITQPLTVSGSTFKEYRIALSDYTGINLAEVTGIQISSEPASEYDFNQSVTLTQIRTFQTPEPSSMILLTLTGMGFAGATWRRRRKLALAA